MKTAAICDLPPSPDPTIETSGADDRSVSRDNIAPLRVRDLNKVYRDSYGPTLPPDEDGQYKSHVMLVHIGRTGADADRRMNNFLELRTPWMSALDRNRAKEAAFLSTKFYGADELAIEFGITYAKRCALGLTTIGSIDVDAGQRQLIRKEKQRLRQRQLRLRDRLQQKPQVTERARRADAINQMLPPGEWFDVPALCVELRRSKTIAFASLNDKTLTAAVHRAIEHGVDKGWFVKRRSPGGRRPTTQIAKRRAS